MVKLSPAFYGLRNKLYVDFTVETLNKTEKNQSINLLDAGGYTGCLTSLVYESLTAKGFSVSAIVLDLSLNALTQNNRRKQINYIRGDINYLPFKSYSFDLVCSYSVFEHLLTPQKAAGELAFVSRKHCIVQIPNMHYFIELHTKTPFLYLFPEVIRKKIVKITGVPYFLNFDVRPKSLTTYFQQAAFRLTTISGIYHTKWTKLLRTPQGYLMRFESINSCNL